MIDDQPPLEAWFVVEVDIDWMRDNPLYVSVTGPFATEQAAESERDHAKEAWEEAIEEWDGDNPYDFKGWNIVEKHISNHQLEKLDQQDEESYQITQEAVGAIGTSLLADEGIGAMSEPLDEAEREQQ